MYSDETTKKGQKYIGFHATDSEKRFYVLGVRDLATKSSEDTLLSFKQVLQDIEDTQKNESTTPIAKKYSEISKTQ